MLQNQLVILGVPLYIYSYFFLLLVASLFIKFSIIIIIAIYFTIIYFCFI